MGFRTFVPLVAACPDGPGESKHADIGISLPGTGEALARLHRRQEGGDAEAPEMLWQLEGEAHRELLQSNGYRPLGCRTPSHHSRPTMGFSQSVTCSPARTLHTQIQMSPPGLMPDGLESRVIEDV